MNATEWINSVVGKPWVDRTDGPDSFDCWGLVIDSFRRIDGIELPEVPGYSSVQPIEEIGAPAAASWIELTSPVDSCVFCVYLNNGSMVHVGRVLTIRKAGVYAVHAAGGNGKGQVVCEPIKSITDRYDWRLKYYVRPSE